jgi:hypothetical protein
MYVCIKKAARKFLELLRRYISPLLDKELKDFFLLISCLRGQHNTVVRGTMLLAGCGLSGRDLNQDWMEWWHRVIIISDN